MRLQLGSPATCSDGQFGELVDVVIDPLTRAVTQLVVEPHHRHWQARLVPIELVGEATDGDALTLDCTTEQARGLERVQHGALMRVGEEFTLDDPDWKIGVEGVLVLPYYASDGSFTHDAAVTARYDRIPKGEIEIRRSSTVTTADDHEIGHVDGFVVDDDEHLTHVLLARGHLWGKREITIPIGDVARVRSDAITLGLTRDEVAELESVPVHRWH